jgi:hypothetical protein
MYPANSRLESEICMMWCTLPQLFQYFRQKFGRLLSQICLQQQAQNTTRKSLCLSNSRNLRSEQNIFLQLAHFQCTFSSLTYVHAVCSLSFDFCVTGTVQCKTLASNKQKTAIRKYNNYISSCFSRQEKGQIRTKSACDS